MGNPESTGGFKVTRRTADLDFAADSPWHGVEAKVVISVPFETLFWYQRNSESKEADVSADAIAQWGDKFLLEWNVLDPEGSPYPPTGEAAQAVADHGLVSSLMMGWMEAVMHPPAPLSSTSENTSQSAAPSMETLAAASSPRGNS